MKPNHALAALALGLGMLTTPALFVSPAQAADPVCVPGFATVQKTSWLLKCSKTVPIALKGVALTEAGNAHCTTERYWNFGPKVSAEHLSRTAVRVSYICGHVES